MEKRKIIVAITGASGAIYAELLLKFLSQQQHIEVGVIMSDNAKTVWQHELTNDNYTQFPFTFYPKNDFNAPFASGSAKYDTMIVIQTRLDGDDEL